MWAISATLAGIGRTIRIMTFVPDDGLAVGESGGCSSNLGIAIIRHSRHQGIVGIHLSAQDFNFGIQAIAFVYSALD